MANLSRSERSSLNESMRLILEDENDGTTPTRPANYKDFLRAQRRSSISTMQQNHSISPLQEEQQQDPSDTLRTGAANRRMSLAAIQEPETAPSTFDEEDNDLEQAKPESSEISNSLRDRQRLYRTMSVMNGRNKKLDFRLHG